ncbi:inhibitor of nuclear factor kappa-B kinase subunit alpha-like [Amphiprion ocellaris]|uniref:inhibitor of nuclear factor kappa-B kinase subunit alpha-like n=1 Tax=Amphiprion ocellaris TaxID=80972 RepID=UPI00241165C6|nr:inhibitor of nuclear factor kappa-B kinase subunit alpha-like [Amphiprion ocellaris]
MHRSLSGHCLFDGRKSQIKMAGYCRGGTAKVYPEMRHGQWAAVKKVPGSLRSHQDITREYQIYKAAEHHNVVKLLESPTMQDNMWHIVMEWIFGENLENIIFDPSSSTIELTPAITRTVITGMCEGLYHLHCKDIVHQDLKPENIMVESYTYRAVIIDLGFAKFYRGGLNSAADIGNLAYAAPEIRTQPGAQRDHCSDVWAMGKIIAELLIGRRISRTSPAYIQEKLSGSAYCDLVSSMLDGSPIPRATMAQVIGAIRTAGRSASEPLFTPCFNQVQRGEVMGVACAMPLLPSHNMPLSLNLPDPLPSNGSVKFYDMKRNPGRRGTTVTQGEIRMRNGQVDRATMITTTNEDDAPLNSLGYWGN